MADFARRKPIVVQAFTPVALQYEIDKAIKDQKSQDWYYESAVIAGTAIDSNSYVAILTFVATD